MIRCSPSKSFKLPTPHEASALKPLRDSDSPLTLWKRVGTLSKQIEDMREAVSQMSTAQVKMRRRIVGGSPPPEVWPPVIYDIAIGYSTGAWVWVQSTDTIVTDGEIYPPTGLTALSAAGVWRCVQSAPAGYFPVAPYPSPDDPTASDMYWLFFGNLQCV